LKLSSMAHTTDSYALQSVWSKAETAIKALRGSQQPKGAQLFEDDEGIFLTFSTKRIVTPPLKPVVISLPTPVASDASVCLFMYDKKEEKLIRELKDRLPKVIPYKKLRRRYKEFPMKRELRDSYDLFVVQKSAARDINHLVASVFHKAHKMPISVSTEGKTADEIVAKIDNLKNCVFFYHPKGASGTIQIARKNMTNEEIKANLVAAVEEIITRTQFKLFDFSSFGIKTVSSPNLPFYQSDAPAYESPSPAASSSKKRKTSSDEASVQAPPPKKHKPAPEKAVQKEKKKSTAKTVLKKTLKKK